MNETKHTFKGVEVRVVETIAGKFVGYIDGTNEKSFSDTETGAVVAVVANWHFRNGVRV